MKNLISLIPVLAIFMLFSAVSTIASDQCPVTSAEFDKLVESNIKNECLIVSKNCATVAITEETVTYSKKNI